MSRVNTVQGPIPAEELGIVAVHEHIGHGMPGCELDTTWRKTPEQRYAEIVPALRQFRDYGGETFVDTTGICNGRDVGYYKWLSAKTGVLIVASTGFNGGHTLLPFFAHASLDYLTQQFVHEITVGIDHTDARAGLIAIGASRGGRMTELDTRIHRAAARAALTTGAPIITDPATNADTAIAIFTEEGLPLERVMFAHTDNHAHDNHPRAENTRDTWIAEQGGWVGFNTRDHNTELEDPPSLLPRPGNKRLHSLPRFIRAGHLNKALASAHANHSPLDRPAVNDHTVNHIFTKLIPSLCNAGLDETAITTLFINNPANFLAIHS